jgi:GMP synthase (glutamine-hydrolysing)
VFSGYDELASVSLGRPPRLPLDAYTGVIVFGGEANVDDSHDWLQRERELIRGWIENGTPVLGVCLGAQLIADVTGAEVRRLDVPEVGWHDVSGSAGFFPDSFLAFEWHRYGFAAAPPGAVELARNDAGCQAFRIASAWAIQFHAEVDGPTVEGWIREYGPEVGADAEALAAQTAREIARWNDFGRALCERFLANARRRGRPAAGPR